MWGFRVLTRRIQSRIKGREPPKTFNLPDLQKKLTVNSAFLLVKRLNWRNRYMKKS